MSRWTRWAMTLSVLGWSAMWMVACTGTPEGSSPPAMERTAQEAHPLPDDPRERAREMGVSYEAGPEGIEVHAEVAGVWVRRESRSGDERVLVPLTPGEPRVFEVGDDIEVLGTIVSFPGDCDLDPARCASPKPIPPSASTIPTRPDRQCVCPSNPCALDAGSPCFDMCCLPSPEPVAPEPVD